MSQLRATSIAPGMLRHTVTLQIARNVTPDGTGHIDLTNNANWVNLCERKALVISTGGEEYQIGDKMRWRATWLVRMRFDQTTKSSNPPMRVLYGSHVFNVRSSYNVEGLNQIIELDCAESSG